MNGRALAPPQKRGYHPSYNSILNLILIRFTPHSPKSAMTKQFAAIFQPCGHRQQNLFSTEQTTEKDTPGAGKKKNEIEIYFTRRKKKAVETMVWSPPTPPTIVNVIIWVEAINLRAEMMGSFGFAGPFSVLCPVLLRLVDHRSCIVRGKRCYSLILPHRQRRCGGGDDGLGQCQIAFIRHFCRREIGAVRSSK